MKTEKTASSDRPASTAIRDFRFKVILDSLRTKSWGTCNERGKRRTVEQELRDTQITLKRAQQDCDFLEQLLEDGAYASISPDLDVAEALKAGLLGLRFRFRAFEFKRLVLEIMMDMVKDGRARDAKHMRQLYRLFVGTELTLPRGTCHGT